MAKVFSVHEIELQPGATAEDFEKLAREQTRQLRQGAGREEIHILKGEEGARAGKYLMLVVLDEETRNRHFPTRGRSEQAPGQIARNLSPLAEQAMPLITSASFTDYVEITDQ